MKRVLITGASGGLGSRLADCFHASGWYCILQHKTQPVVTTTDTVEVRGDLGSQSTIDTLKSLMEGKGLDVLINNAAVREGKELHKYSRGEISNALMVNLIAPMLLVQQLWEPLRKQRGLIVNVNSLAVKSVDDDPVYSASKHGLAGFSKSIRGACEKHHIRLIDVYLGAMRTTMTKGRDDRDKLMDPSAVAGRIFDLCNLPFNSGYLTEVVMARSVR